MRIALEHHLSSASHLFWVCSLWVLHLVPRWRSPSEERQGCCHGSCCCCSCSCCSCCCCFCCIIRFQWQNIWSMNMYMYMTIDHGQLLLLLSPHFIEIISILSLSIGLALIPVAFQTTSLGPVNSSPIFATNFGPPHLNQIPMVQAQW